MPPFPSGVVPDVVANYATLMARSSGCDPSGCAWSAIVSIQATLDHRLRVRVTRHGNYLVGPNLWLALIGEVSSRKSHPVGEAIERTKTLDVRTRLLAKDIKVTGYVKYPPAEKPKRGRLEQDPYASTDFTAYTLEPGRSVRRQAGSRTRPCFAAYPPPVFGSPGSVGAVPTRTRMLKLGDGRAHGVIPFLHGGSPTALSVVVPGCRAS